jgi:hypothetical protein
VTFTEGEVRRLPGTTVYDSSDERVGTIGQVWSDTTGEPSWASVNTGLFGLNETLMPLVGAEFAGSRLRTPFGKSLIHDAPNVDSDVDQPLDDNSRRRLYAHYSLPYDDNAGDGSSTAH